MTIRGTVTSQAGFVRFDVEVTKREPENEFVRTSGGRVRTVAARRKDSPWKFPDWKPKTGAKNTRTNAETAAIDSIFSAFGRGDPSGGNFERTAAKSDADVSYRDRQKNRPFSRIFVFISPAG